MRILLSGLLLIAGCTNLPQEPLEPTPPPEPGVMVYEVFGKTYRTRRDSLGYLEIGVASWYGTKFHGRLTANGESYDMYALSAAHKTLPLPTWVRVTNLDNGRKVVLRVNDRGPFHDDRLIDLSWAAARELGFADQGTAPVVVEALDQRNYPDLVAREQLPTFYLQVGAFGELPRARALAARVRQVLEGELPGDNVKVLQSEFGADVILHKVWIGPILDEQAEVLIESRLIEGGFSRPIRVTVE